MKPDPAPSRRITPTERVRDWIEKAEATGMDRAEMTLRLTLGDVSYLKRDRNLAVSDIGFADGVMRFLGVRIEAGGVAESLLQQGASPEPATAAADVKAPAPRKRRAAPRRS